MVRAQESVEEPGAAPDPETRLVTETRLVRRPPGGRLVVAGLLVPALLTGAAGYLGGPAAEDSLISQAGASLRTNGVKGVRLEADGPFLTALVPTRVDRAKVEGVVGAVDGVSAVTLEEVYSSKKEARACTGLGAKLDRATDNQRIPFVGESTRLTSSGRRMVLAAAELVSACGAARVYVGGHADPATVDGSTLSLQRARVMIRLMRRAGTPEERMVARGYGAQYPVSEGDGPAARQRNQRGSIIPMEE